MNNSNTKVIISWILLSTVFFVIANSLVTEDLLDEMNQHPDCQAGKCQIVEVKLLKRQRRSAGIGLTFRFTVPINGANVVLNLKPSNGILFNANTPVYSFNPRQDTTFVETKFNIFNDSFLSMHLIDEEKHAAVRVIFDPITLEPTFRTGFIGSENVIIDQTTSNPNYYIARPISNLKSDMLGIGLNFRNPVKSNLRIPETIYPEVLIIVDYQIYKHFGGELLPYIIQFWNGVDLYFRQLRNPRYKIAIGGIAIAMDENVLPFGSPSNWGINNLIPYNSTLELMTEWLRNTREVIPFNSYDTHIYMTPYRDGLVTQGTAVGMAYVSSACTSVTEGSPKGGIVYDPFNLAGILPTVHELGHVFGARHDKEWPCSSQSVMWPYTSPGHALWSECSKYSFYTNLRDSDFSCMYNVPLQNTNVPTTNTQISHSTNYNYNEPSAPFHQEISDDRIQLTVGSAQFLPNREISVYWINNKLVITQRYTEDKEPSTDPNASKKDLQGRFTDNYNITFHPSIINPSKLVNIYHEDGYIYIYQGNKPTGDTNGSQQSDNNDQGSDLYSTDSQFCVQRSTFKLHKVVEIYYRNNLLYFSQRNVPDNPYLYNSIPFPSVLKFVPDTETFTMIPTQISTGMTICVGHTSNMIYINNLNWQPTY